MPPDEFIADRHVFVSFSSRNKAEAASVCERLERDGFRCWISFRDVRPGQNFQAAIVDAIQSAGAMVLVFSSQANSSDELGKELALASACKVPVFPFRIEDVLPLGGLRYELATRQWIDAFADWDAALDELVRAIRSAGETGTTPVPASSMPLPGLPPPKPAPVRIPEAAIEAARTALAVHVGPIARVLVRKAAAEAASLDDFHDRLAERIPADKDRTGFRSLVRQGARPGPTRPEK